MIGLAVAASAALAVIAGVVLAGGPDQRSAPTIAPTPTPVITTTTAATTTTTTTPSTTSVAAPGVSVPAALRGKDVEYLPTRERVVALTFDAGANAVAVPSILATLRAHDVPGTFFLTGAFVDAEPDAVARIVADGHRLANHSQTHPRFTELSGAEIAAELAGAQRRITAAGAATSPRWTPTPCPA